MPKTGGSTVNTVVGAEFDEPAKFTAVNTAPDIAKVRTALAGGSRRRDKIRLVSGHAAGALISEFSDFALASIVREPTEWAVSNWFHHKDPERVARNGPNAVMATRTLGEAFESEPEWRNGQTRFFARALGIDDHAFSKDLIEQILDRFTLIGVTDNLDLFIFLIRKNCDLEMAPYAIKNRGTNKVTGILDAETAEIERQCKWDALLYEQSQKRFGWAVSDAFSAHPNWESEWYDFREMLSAYRSDQHDRHFVHRDEYERVMAELERHAPMSRRTN